MRRQSLIVVTCFLFGCLGNSTWGQIVNACPYANHQNSLACLIPDLTKTGNSSNLSAFNTTLAQVVGQLPLAVPVSGFVLGFDKSGIPIDINQNLGSVLTERGNTVGRYKLFLGFTYQRFVFQSVDGTNIHDLPLVFLTPSGVYGQSNNGLSANVSQYTAIAAFGLTNRIDVSATLPFQRISLSGAHGLVNEYNSLGVQTTPPTSCPGSSNLQLALCPLAIAGSASGIGDLLLNVKGTALNGERSKIAVGVETRIPTGDPYNLLGSGAYGVKPYLVFSRFSGRFTPHLNVGYQWNGFSILRINPCYYSSPACGAGSSTAKIPTLRLPDSLDYSIGTDVGIAKKVSLVADWVGQHFYNAPRVNPAMPANSANIPGLPLAALGTAPTVTVSSSNYNVNNLGVGIKFNPVGKLILSANALIRLDSGGLRPDRFVPLVGISYRF